MSMYFNLVCHQCRVAVGIARKGERIEPWLENVNVPAFAVAHVGHPLEVIDENHAVYTEYDEYEPAQG